MTSQNITLADLGWNSFFAGQLKIEENGLPVRVMAVHRDRLHVVGPEIDTLVSPFRESGEGNMAVATVGDWLLLDAQTARPSRLLRRRSLFKRRAAGTARNLQLIAANVDTLFIVSSCNQEFNPARLERYLAVAREAEVTPVIVLTKADATDNTGEFVRKAQKLLPGLLVEAVDAREAQSVTCLTPWCSRGQTIALLGSSGVGKSTLVNTLAGHHLAQTQDIREDDAKGRHTTTGRTLCRLPAGGWLIDTPGMRELQLTDVAAGVDEVFADIVSLARNCRFNDCRHQTEPGCAIQSAVELGKIEASRIKRWHKLAAEEAFNGARLAERNAHGRDFAKLTNKARKAKKRARCDE
ncbi:ribosome small subunit-dependent GTPase A [Ensifer sp. SL37]|uniref:ribosome small subunit-dependent GTPase A n=1 Tax=Ensifer sp. SL37 TaxID=2995137 RepID=UPI002275F14E|nr:ribosome small subunit-dependent GTPase A [Ensifer sp. SL37]MCY1745063.1 ribosome small subunit-dependent GTPase A [Ensifer sp. SL37]